MSSEQAWLFSENSNALMSLLASRFHEWSDWKLTEFGKGQVSKDNVYKVLLTLFVNSEVKSVYLEPGDSVVDAYEDALASKPTNIEIMSDYRQKWRAEKFVSEFGLDNASYTYWAVERSSSGFPTLWVTRD